MKKTSSISYLKKKEKKNVHAKKKENKNFFFREKRKRKMSMLKIWSRLNLFNFLDHFLFSNFLPKCSLGSICLKCFNGFESLSSENTQRPTLFLAFLSLKEAWTIMKRKGKMTPERKTRMQPN